MAEVPKNGGCCWSSELAIVVPRRSWRGTLCGKLQRAKISWDGATSPRPKIPCILGRPKGNSSYGQVCPRKAVSLKGCTSKGCALFCAPPRSKTTAMGGDGGGEGSPVLTL
jgi:hypothetical protein